jgi:hypothetical protein
MKEIVMVILAVDAKTGTIIPDAPFLVKAGPFIKTRASRATSSRRQGGGTCCERCGTSTRGRTGLIITLL